MQVFNGLDANELAIKENFWLSAEIGVNPHGQQSENK
jgi:hypothetical protein